jgi:hypothetical protein
LLGDFLPMGEQSVQLEGPGLSFEIAHVSSSGS